MELPQLDQQRLCGHTGSGGVNPAPIHPVATGGTKAEGDQVEAGMDEDETAQHDQWDLRWWDTVSWEAITHIAAVTTALVPAGIAHAVATFKDRI